MQLRLLLPFLLVFVGFACTDKDLAKTSPEVESSNAGEQVGSKAVSRSEGSARREGSANRKGPEETASRQDPKSEGGADSGPVAAADVIELSESEWRAKLTKEQFYVLREKGTERSFTGKYWNEKRKGVYKCAGCGLALFDSKTKFRSGTGWPSFYAPTAKENVAEKVDKSLWETRTEALCSRCGGHLGHVFPDGPRPTGLRYCINSAALELEESSSEDKN